MMQYAILCSGFENFLVLIYLLNVENAKCLLFQELNAILLLQAWDRLGRKQNLYIQYFVVNL